MTEYPFFKTPEDFQAMIEHSLDIVTIIDEFGKIAFQSPSIRILGYEQGELSGQSVMDRVHPEDKQRIGSALMNILVPTEKIERHELRFLHKSGEWRHIEVVGTHFSRENFRGAIINTRDISEQHSMLQALERSNTLFSEVFSVSRNMLSISIPETGIFVDVNDQWLSTLEFTREEVIGKSAIELNVWGSQAHRDQVMADLSSDGILQDYETYALTKSGEQKDLILNTTFIEVMGETRLLFSATDVTDRHKMEDQLRQSQKMEAIGQLTGGVAHDFNNLLSIVTGSAELISALAPNNEQVLELTNAILRASDRGAALTQQLLAFSRRQALRPHSVYLGKLVTEMTPMLERTLGSNILVDVTNEPELWPCYADPGQIENAILNIALNARDAMPSGGKLNISTRNHRVDDATGDPDFVNDGDYVELAISDTGTGMSSEVIDQVFEPFFTTKEFGKGTGLGLSMVFGFVKQSGGHIFVESEPDNGSKITLILPRSAESTRATSDPGQLSMGLGERVLLLEDNIELQKVTSQLLIQLGYQVSTAGSEVELNDLVNDQEFDLLVSDVMLPGDKQGPEIAAALKQRFPAMKVLLISGYAKSALNDNTEVPRLLMKPYTKEQLADAVRSVLEAEPTRTPRRRK